MKAIKLVTLLATALVLGSCGPQQGGQSSSSAPAPTSEPTSEEPTSTGTSTSEEPAAPTLESVIGAIAQSLFGNATAYGSNSSTGGYYTGAWFEEYEYNETNCVAICTQLCNYVPTDAGLAVYSATEWDSDDGTAYALYANSDYTICVQIMTYNATEVGKTAGIMGQIDVFDYTKQ